MDLKTLFVGTMVVWFMYELLRIGVRRLKNLK